MAELRLEGVYAQEFAQEFGSAVILQMSIKTRFCAKCGSPTDLTIQGLCPKCYIDERGIIVPHKLELRLCPKCGSIKWLGMWIAPDQPIEFYLEQLARSKIKLPERVTLEKLKVDPDSSRMDLQLKILGQQLDLAFEAVASINKFACPACSRQFGGDWLAKVQVRTDGDVEDIKSKCLNYAKRFSKQISKIDEQKRGLDFLFYEKPSASKLADILKDQLDARYSTTQEGIKIKHGTTVHKDVILLTV